MAVIRENSIHAPAQAPFKAPTAQTFGDVHNVASRVSPGGMNSYLGHFAQPGNLMRGHNSGGHPRGQHPGFKAVQAKIASKEGVSEKAAGAILANSTRHASAGAKRRNPRLKRVK